MKPRALIVAVRSKSISPRRRYSSAFTEDDSLDELQELAHAAGAVVVDRILQQRPTLDPAYFIGHGKAIDICDQAKAQSVELIVFDDELTPTQLRNLERLMGCRVIDRTQLILDIFAQRARTREGKLQVELAQLEYLRPRLTGRGVELSRLGAGIGTRGPGETKLEIDRRRIVHRIARIRSEMERVRAQRTLQRSHRRNTSLSTISLVGYTNAGKSTLFNAMTSAQVKVSRQLFSTLDPTLRRIVLPSKRVALLSDTVGFIRKLPHTLVSAFRATLEEVVQADLILHVIDGADSHYPQRESAVQSVLEELEVTHTPVLKVYNKLDLAPGTPRNGNPHEAVWVSALTGEGLDELVEQIDTLLVGDPLVDCRLLLPHAATKALDLIHRKGKLLEKEVSDDFIRVHAQIPHSVALRLQSYVQ